MPMLARPILVAALALAATAALAQATNPGNAGPRGFFSSQPQSDPSLFRTLPPEAYGATPDAESAGAQPQGPAHGGTAGPPLVVVVPGAGNGRQEQFDRSEREAQQAQMNRAPAPINGAFTGNTDPDNR